MIGGYLFLQRRYAIRPIGFIPLGFALATWLIYAVYLHARNLHARNQRSWAGRPAALLLVVGFGMVLVTYSGSLWFSGLHAYSGL